MQTNIETIKKVYNMPLARNNNLNIWQNQEKEVNKENFQSPKICEKKTSHLIQYLCCTFVAVLQNKNKKMIHPNWPQYSIKLHYVCL